MKGNKLFIVSIAEILLGIAINALALCQRPEQMAAVFAALCAGAKTDPAHAAAPLSLTFAIANEMTGTSIIKVPAMASEVVPAFRITSAASSVTPP